MISTLLAAAALAAGFQHATPSPPADLAASIYRERRERLMKALDGCIAVIGSQGEVSGITEDYRQDADFYWLTGINEPGAFLVFTPKAPFGCGVDRPTARSREPVRTMIASASLPRRAWRRKTATTQSWRLGSRSA